MAGKGTKRRSETPETGCAKDVGASAPTPRTRLAPEVRRRQLLDVAATLLTERGVDQVQITDLAEAAGVTRPVVYKFFPTRTALVVAVVEDFEAMLEQRYAQAFAAAYPDSLESVVRLFMIASIEAIETKGAGPWHALDARTSDPELAQIGVQFHARLLAPWRAHLLDKTGAPLVELETILRVVVTSSRAVLDRYIDGALDRAQAIELSTFATTALLEAFERRTQSRITKS